MTTLEFAQKELRASKIAMIKALAANKPDERQHHYNNARSHKVKAENLAHMLDIESRLFAGPVVHRGGGELRIATR